MLKVACAKCGEDCFHAYGTSGGDQYHFGCLPTRAEKKAEEKLFLGSSTRHEKTACLNCGRGLDGAEGVSTWEAVKPGAVGICSNCGHIQAYDENMKFRPLTSEEIASLADDARVDAIQRARKLFMDRVVQ